MNGKDYSKGFATQRCMTCRVFSTGFIYHWTLLAFSQVVHYLVRQYRVTGSAKTALSGEIQRLVTSVHYVTSSWKGSPLAGKAIGRPGKYAGRGCCPDDAVTKSWHKYGIAWHKHGRTDARNTDGACSNVTKQLEHKRAQDTADGHSRASQSF